ncbi:MAG: hypothetical protein JXA24_06565 [Proteobacteria bacterium]|nr:hypothetical protein [Pseudomonadota bacterium]
MAVVPLAYVLAAGCGSGSLDYFGDGSGLEQPPEGPSPPVPPRTPVVLSLSATPWTLENSIEWRVVSGDADSFNLAWQVDEEASASVIALSEAAGEIEDVSSPFVHDGLSNNGVEYCYRIVPVFDGEKGDTSDEVCAMPDTVGIPDDSFGAEGVITDDLGGGLDEIGYAVGHDASGRALVAGYEFNAALGSKMALWRFLSDGSPDAGFGAGGLASYDVGKPDRIWDGNALAIDASGRVIVPGFINDAPLVNTATIWRYGPDGALDATFDGDGIYRFANPHEGGRGNYDWMYDVKVDPSGRIVIAGISFFAADWLLHMSIWRLLDDGTVDPAFNGGVPVDYINPGSGSDYGFALELDADGRIVIGGSSMEGGWPRGRVALWRYLDDGTPDPSFNGGTPIIMTRVAGDTDDAIRALVIDAEERILAAGSRDNASGGKDLCIWRFLEDGSLDPAFGAAGEIRYDAGAANEDIAYGIAEDVHGRIVVGGEMGEKAVVHRYLEDGSLDPAFGEGGVYEYDKSGDDAAGGITIDSRGRILTTGHIKGPGGNLDMAVWRLK